ncbi:16116_t:CDS:2, partial [Gigaspora margarita]
KHKNHKLDRVHFNFQESLEFTADMVRDVEFYMRKMNCSPQQICKALEEKYSVKVNMPVLYQPSIQRIIEKKEIDPRWYVECLKFEDIILNDNTAATNHYDMALSLFLVVYNYLSSCL